MKYFKKLKNEEGLTLVELLGSIVILSIIVLAFLGFFIQSARTTQVSDEILDASYIAQQQAEEIYNLTNTMNYSDLMNYFEFENGYIPDAGGYSTQIEGHRVHYYLYPVENEEGIIKDLYTLLIRVYDSSDKQSAQIETKIIFDGAGEENEE